MFAGSIQMYRKEAQCSRMQPKVSGEKHRAAAESSSDSREHQTTSKHIKRHQRTSDDISLAAMVVGIQAFDDGVEHKKSGLTALAVRRFGLCDV
jgi:hypothetical protein